MCCSSKRRYAAAPAPTTEPRMLAYPACANGVSSPRRRCGGGGGNGGCHNRPGLIRTLIGTYKERKAQQQAERQQQQQVQYVPVQVAEASQIPPEGADRRRSIGEEKEYTDAGNDDIHVGNQEALPRYEEVMKA